MATPRRLAGMAIMASIGLTGGVFWALVIARLRKPLLVGAAQAAEP
jgi:hypothetical protein